jgi:hypothetical protein
MAVFNDYVNPDVQAGNRTVSVFSQGQRDASSSQTFTVQAADDNGSVYRIFKKLPMTHRIQRIQILNDALTGGSDFDLGFYQTQQPDGSMGVAISQDALASGMDLSVGHNTTNPLSGLTALSIAQVGIETIGQILAFTPFQPPYEVDLVLTANTVGTTSGQITVLVEWIPAAV